MIKKRRGEVMFTLHKKIIVDEKGKPTKVLVYGWGVYYKSTEIDNWKTAVPMPVPDF